MEYKSTRSEQVIEAFKRHRLASSVYRKIHRLIEAFEQDEKLDRQFAEIGMVVLLVVTGFAVYFTRVF
jgi:hypothetical protein